MLIDCPLCATAYDVQEASLPREAVDLDEGRPLIDDVLVRFVNRRDVLAAPHREVVNGAHPPC
jgi:hypothetical protein